VDTNYFTGRLGVGFKYSSALEAVVMGVMDFDLVGIKDCIDYYSLGSSCSWVRSQNLGNFMSFVILNLNF